MIIHSITSQIVDAIIPPTVAVYMNGTSNWTNSNGSELGALTIRVEVVLNGATGVYWHHAGNGEYAITYGTITSSGTHYINIGGWMEEGNGESILITFKVNNSDGNVISNHTFYFA